MSNELRKLLQPTGEEQTAARAAVDRVAELLRQYLTLDTGEHVRVHVGGSCGRRTCVRGHFDVDLIFFVDGLDANDEDQVLQLLTHVKAALEDSGVSDGPVALRPDLCMVQLKSEGVKMDVLLVRNELSSESDYAEKARVQRDALVGPLLRWRWWSSRPVPENRARERGVVEAFAAFVDAQPPVAKEAVLLFKAWVKLGLAECGKLTSKKLPSVALELIALHAFQMEQEEAGRNSSGDTMLLRTFLRCLRLARDLLKRSFLRPAPVVMVDAGRRLGYRRKQGMRFRSSWGPGPFIIHPIDPSCNVAREAHRGKPPWDWAGLAREAGALLDAMVVEGEGGGTLGSWWQASGLEAALGRLQPAGEAAERVPGRAAGSGRAGSNAVAKRKRGSSRLGLVAALAWLMRVALAWLMRVAQAFLLLVAVLVVYWLPVFLYGDWFWNDVTDWVKWRLYGW